MARWASHLRQLVDAWFPKDADAAQALQITPATLSCYLSGKKEVPERVFVRRLHEVLARREGAPVDSRGLERSDELYLAALAVLQPVVWEVHTLTDQRNAAHRREQEVLDKLRRTHTFLEAAERDVTTLRRDLRRARKEQEALAFRTQALLRQLRRAQKEAAEAVVAEAIRIAEEAAVVQSARDAAARKTSKIIIAASAAAGVAGAALAALGPQLLDGGIPWQVWGWAAFGAAVLAATAAATWRYRLLRRLGVYWDWRVHLLLIATCMVIPTGSAFFLAAALTTHQDYLAHQVRVSAAVSDCEQDGEVLVNAGGGQGPNEYAPTYACMYQWTVNDRTYRQRTDGLLELEGKRTTVFVDPTHPDTMVPEVMARYKDLYAVAAICLFCLFVPVMALKELQGKVAYRVRNKVDQVLVRAKDSADDTMASA